MALGKLNLTNHSLKSVCARVSRVLFCSRNSSILSSKLERISAIDFCSSSGGRLILIFFNPEIVSALCVDPIVISFSLSLPIKDKKKCFAICKDLGKKIRLMHDNNIVHGDLTTSNMMLLDNKVYFIDFGLSQVSTKNEDKAVDLHLLKQALESKHYKIWEACFKVIAKAYGHKEILNRLEKVESRGKYKGKGS